MLHYEALRQLTQSVCANASTRLTPSVWRSRLAAGATGEHAGCVGGRPRAPGHSTPCDRVSRPLRGSASEDSVAVPGAPPR